MHRSAHCPRRSFSLLTAPQFCRPVSRPLRHAPSPFPPSHPPLRAPLAYELQVPPSRQSIFLHSPVHPPALTLSPATVHPCPRGQVPSLIPLGPCCRPPLCPSRLSLLGLEPCPACAHIAWCALHAGLPAPLLPRTHQPLLSCYMS